MSLFSAEQLEELGAISTGLIDHLRAVVRNEQPDPHPCWRMLDRLHAAYGFAGASFVVRAWFDMVIEACPDVVRGEEYAVVVAGPDSGEFLDLNDLGVEYRWAASALAARLSDDQVSLYEMIDRLPRNGRLNLYLLRAAEIVACTLEAVAAPRVSALQAGDVITLFPDTRRAS